MRKCVITLSIWTNAGKIKHLDAGTAASLPVDVRALLFHQQYRTASFDWTPLLLHDRVLKSLLAPISPSGASTHIYCIYRLTTHPIINPFSGIHTSAPEKRHFLLSCEWHATLARVYTKCPWLLIFYFDSVLFCSLSNVIAVCFTFLPCPYTCSGRKSLRPHRFSGRLREAVAYVIAGASLSPTKASTRSSQDLSSFLAEWMCWTKCLVFLCIGLDYYITLIF